MQLKHGPALAERGGREARGATGARGGSTEELAGPVQRGRGVGFGPEGEGGHGLEGRRRAAGAERAGLVRRRRWAAGLD